MRGISLRPRDGGLHGGGGLNDGWIRGLAAGAQGQKQKDEQSEMTDSDHQTIVTGTGHNGKNLSHGLNTE
jgi:hypothetical protein